MKKIFIACALIISFNGIAQSKKESEDWLIYYMNKNFGSSRDSRLEKTYLREGKSYTYTNREFAITSGKLIIRTTENQKRDSTSAIPILTKQKRTTIDLSRIIKVSKETSSSDAQVYGLYWMKIFLEFSETDFNNLSVREYDELNHMDLTGKKYVKFYQITSEYSNENILKEDFPNRLLKAFEKVAEYNGAKLLKEVF